MQNMPGNMDANNFNLNSNEYAQQQYANMGFYGNQDLNDPNN